MDNTTVIIYKTAARELRFAYDSDLWIEEESSFSSVTVEIASTSAYGQIGGDITNQQVRPKTLTIDGAVKGDVEANRRIILNVIQPLVPAQIIVQTGGKSYYLAGFPNVTPIFENGVGLQKFQLQFFVPFPYWQSFDEATYHFRKTNKLFKFPTSLAGNWYISTFDEALNINAYNNGNVPTGVIITVSVYQDITEPITITNLTTGAFITIVSGFPIEAGSTIVISTVQGNQSATITDSDGNTKNAWYLVARPSDMRFSLAAGDNQLSLDTGATPSTAVLVWLTAPKEVVSGV